MSQKTYQRPKLFIQVKNVARTEIWWSWIIPLANAKSLFKIYFGHKIFIFLTISKNFSAHYTTNWELNVVRKIFCLPPNKLYIILENQLSKLKNSTLVEERNGIESDNFPRGKNQLCSRFSFNLFPEGIGKMDHLKEAFILCYGISLSINSP